MKISASYFLEKYKQLFLAKTPGIAVFAYWKVKYLIENGESFYLPQHDCCYTVYNNHLVVYHSPDNKMHIPADVLNSFDCISLPAHLYDSVKGQLTGFSPSYAWGLRYDFSYRPKNDKSPLYEAVDFDFTSQQHFAKAAEIINGGKEWLNDKNIKKMMSYSAFDPSLWFFVKDKATGSLAAISISAYDNDVKQTDLDWIFVAPEYHGKGCGRFLIEETIRRCKDKSDDICVGGAVEFYRKCGFVDYELWAWVPKDGYQFKAYGITPSV
ncbi:MAG: GNAT family N-acetyltransferase [Firmicutes bacterium]|nr:GNAT family N-acetyltransferase [Bacillota bacterium]